MNDENVTKKIQDRERPTDGIEFRIGTLEKHNQIRKISSTDGKTYFDTESGEFRITNTDGSYISISSAGIIFKDKDGNMVREMLATKDTFFDGANEVVRLGDLS